ncbi:polysaccharide deacetylase family protein [Natrialbaceae archaeon AArc-T1-2]|uniref:polysaccharide deacetylase family protein n=1 Tax=Natrialbaceae archaeon AArc-T1-2 TaxID=3053904 RepID=UPI00255AC16E|nr:polysaccharide deacetylase family protein [Natrialbaceae archaeon AArc-T1-2]WIV67495.1 polysaccharide deacetylase family protein [Natrialbaceae archaeon AArc-T1-2]
MRRRNALYYTAIGIGTALSGCLSRDGDGSASESEPRERASAVDSSPEPESEWRSWPAGTAIETVEDVRTEDIDENWGVTGTAATGSQSIYYAGSTNGSVAFDYADDPLDLTESGMALIVKAKDYSTGASPFVELEDGDGNRWRFRQRVSAAADGWIRIDLAIDDPAVDGVEPDLSAIETIRLRPSPSSNESGRPRLYFDSLWRTPSFDTAKVVLQFDDGHETQYTEAFPILSSYGWSATTYVTTDWIGNDDRCDLDQLEELQDDGWIVGNHTVTHPNLRGLSVEEVEAEVEGAREWLIEHGFQEGANHFAYPENGYSRDAIDVVREHHQTGRVSSLSYPVVFPTNPQLVSGDGDPESSRVERIVDRTIEHGGIYAPYWHRLTGETVDDFRNSMEYIRARERDGDLEVIRMDELHRQLGGDGSTATRG